MDLANYLKFLLYNHDEVPVPGLGTLVTLYKHAEINESEKTISPPTKYLTFKPNAEISDDLLLKYIAHSDDISLEEAKIKLTQVTIELNQKLNNEETVYLEGIGYFAKDQDIVRFEREQEANFLTDSFGLSNIDYEPIDDVFITHSPEIIEVVKPKRYTSLIVTLIIMFLFGGGIILYLNYPDIINLNNNKKVVAPVRIPEITDTTQQKAFNDSTENPNKEIESFYETVTDKKNALAIPNQQQEQKYKYYIIAGSFLTYQKAETMAKYIEKDGYKTEIIKFGDKLRISLGVFTDKEKALEELEKIRYAKGADAVWLLTEPLKP